jgi:hypothetical protein
MWFSVFWKNVATIFYLCRARHYLRSQRWELLIYTHNVKSYPCINPHQHRWILHQATVIPVSISSVDRGWRWGSQLLRKKSANRWFCFQVRHPRGVFQYLDIVYSLTILTQSSYILSLSTEKHNRDSFPENYKYQSRIHPEIWRPKNSCVSQVIYNL